MDVPDALRTLDDELSAGRIDPTSYRRRRDELAAGGRRAAPDPGGREPGREHAAGGGTAAPAAPPGAPDEPSVVAPEPVVSQPVVSEPVVPLPRPVGPQVAPPLPDRAAQALRAAPAGGDEPRPPTRDPFPPPYRWGDPDDPDATQVVPPHGADPDPGAAERTQFVRGTEATRAGATSGPSAAPPPWSSGIVARRQGAELFVRSPGPSPAALISTTLVVLVAALVVVLSVVLS